MGQPFLKMFVIDAIDLIDLVDLIGCAPQVCNYPLHRAQKLGPLLRFQMGFATSADQSELSRDRGCPFWANRFSRCL